MRQQEGEGGGAGAPSAEAVGDRGGREAAAECALLCVPCVLVTCLGCGISRGAAWAGGAVWFRFPRTGLLIS